MIKTLRITGILAVILAGIFFAFPVFFGVRSDEKVEEFLNSPGILEKFNQERDSQKTTDKSQTSPLVRQAEAFAQIINPPQPVQRTIPSMGAQPTILPRPPKVSAKFTLVGTCYYLANPENSLAFINEPGKGLHWIRQADEVGHLIIEQIKDGLVLVRDGQRTFEINVEPKPPQRSLLEGSSISTDIEVRPDLQPIIGLVPDGTSTSFFSPAKNPPQITDEESGALEDLVNKLKDLQRNIKSQKTDSGPTPEDKDALMEKIISDFRAARVSAEEARKLDDLGKVLKNINNNHEHEESNKIEK